MLKQNFTASAFKSHAPKLPKKLPIYKMKREQIMLLSPSSFKKFNVYSDLEVGIDKKTQNTILKSVSIPLYRLETKIMKVQMKSSEWGSRNVSRY